MNTWKGIYLCGLWLTLSLHLYPAQADLYKWVDSKGAIHYGDKPPEQAKLKDIKGRISSFKTPEIIPLPAGVKRTLKTNSRVSVIMYSASWCKYCKKAASHFKRNNIAFKEYDVEKTTKGANDYKKLKGRGVPVILIGNQRMNGFNASQFDSIYARES